MENEGPKVAVLEDLFRRNSVHEDFIIQEVGFIRSTEFPYLGVSPDRLISCKCHGLGVIEMKGSFKYHGFTVAHAVQTDPTFPLRKSDSTGEFYLDKNHEYYHQVQMQLLVTKRSFCIFVMFTKSDLVHILVNRDEELMEQLVAIGKLYFCEMILPELVSKMWTSPSRPSSASSPGPLSDRDIPANPSSAPLNPPTAAHDLSVKQVPSKYLPCICQNPKNDTLITCSNSDCVVKRYHRSCVRQKIIRNGWICDVCRKLINSKKSKEKRLKGKENVPPR